MARSTLAATPELAGSGHIPIATLPGLGQAAQEKLKARDLTCLQDLWLWLPLRYEDRTQLTAITALQAGIAAQVEGQVSAVHTSFRSRPMLRVTLDDGSGTSLILRFFHFHPNQAQQLVNGIYLRCYGLPRLSSYGLEMVHPSYRVFRPGYAPELEQRLDPVYPVVEGIGPLTLRRIVAQALEYLPDEAQLELLPADALAGLPSLRQALLILHHPPVDTDLNALAQGHHPAQQRLALEELLAHQLSQHQQRLWRQQQSAPVLCKRGLRAKLLLQSLPFKLTPAQQRVFAEIRADLTRPQPMLRLVQGDVGCGKTIIAVLAALLVVDHGKQAALVAPTELLAEQHLDNLRTWLEPLDVNVAWLAGKITGKARTKVLNDIASGQAQVIIGTHALMQTSVLFHNLALTIIDEQHRFGVQQRLTLRDKGTSGTRVPHQLIMTATPIPRTLAMTAYADIEVSVIDQLPPGRTPVQTVVISSARRDYLIERIRLACQQGRQAYWVCTLIDENEDIIANAAHNTWQTLSEQLPELHIGLVHGRMKAAEKQAAMQAFKEGQLHLLVATTVIEVGVDVPNASLMVIDNAERLGLAQLHQLRGRVGRGNEASHCVLLYQPPLSPMAKARLQTLRQTNDGFEIAEKDLELRGPGELLGTRQTGLASFHIADLQRDAALLPQVQQLAEHVLIHFPEQADALISRWIGRAVRYAAA